MIVYVLFAVAGAVAGSLLIKWSHRFAVKLHPVAELAVAALIVFLSVLVADINVVGPACVRQIENVLSSSSDVSLSWDLATGDPIITVICGGEEDEPPETHRYHANSIVLSEDAEAPMAVIRYDNFKECTLSVTWPKAGTLKHYEKMTEDLVSEGD